MPETDMSKLDYSDLTTQVTDYSVDTETTDGIADQKETTYTWEDWPDNFGYYNTIPELMAVIDARATWTIGKGFIADEGTSLTLDQIKGFGKDTFNTILENMIRTYYIAGDAFAEIIGKVGAEHSILATDLGQIHNPPPVEGMRVFIQILLEKGMNPQDIEIMVKKNPAKLLNLESS